MQDMYDVFPGFETCIALIRSGDSHSSMQGFWWLEGRISQYTDQIIPLLKAEQDPFIRGFLVELLGRTKDPSVIPVLEAELSHGERQVREFAVLGLDEIGGAYAEALSQDYKAAHPDEWGETDAATVGKNR